jgi:ankyrin repeat protein
MSTPATSNFRLGLIYFVGMVNLAIGGLYVALGLWILLAGADAVATIFQARQNVDAAVGQLPVDPQSLKSFGDYLTLASQGISGLILALASVVAGCSIVQGLPLVLVGAGIFLRQRWARVFALFFAALGLLEGVACLLGRGSSLVPLVGSVLVIYGVVAFVALLGRGASDYFARRDLTPAGETAAPASRWPLAAAAAVVALLAAGIVGAGWYLMRPATPPIGAPPLAGVPAPSKPPEKEFPPDPSLPRYKQRLEALMDAIEHGQTSRVQELIKEGIGVNDRGGEKSETPLMKLVQAGYADLWGVLLDKGANPGVRDREGNDVFLYAAARGKFAWLVRAAPWNTPATIRTSAHSGDDWRSILLSSANHKKATAAMLAAANGHLDDLQFMVAGFTQAPATGVDVKDWLARKDIDGKTALDHARAKGHLEIAKYLESLTPGSGTTVAAKKPPVTDADVAAFVKAITAADADALDRILRQASDDVKKELVRARDKEGKTTLIHAAAQADATPLMLLQQAIRMHGAIGLVAVTDKRERTALHYAAEAGNTDTLRKLLDMVSLGWKNYPDVSSKENTVHWFRCVRQRDSAGKTAFDLAQDKGHKPAADVLTRYTKEQFDEPTFQQRSVLELACYPGDLALVKELLQAGCPPMRPASAYANGGTTPLMQATGAGNIMVVKALLDSFGKDEKKRLEYVNFRIANISALQTATNFNQPEIAALLRANGAKH